jgi:hypothetical protein
MTSTPVSDVIGGFPIVSDYCFGCGKALLIKNAWMTDGCPCNSKLGINSLNETRWRLLMSLQQQQLHVTERHAEHIVTNIVDRVLVNTTPVSAADAKVLIREIVMQRLFS